MKKSFGNCLKCPLNKQCMVIGESSTPKDITEAELLVLGEAPASEEAKEDRPLVGPSGKIYRYCEKESGLIDIPRYITNVCLCTNLTETGKTDNPPEEAYDCCSKNLDVLIETIKPKYILALGSSVAKRLGNKGKIKDIKGTSFSYKDIPVFVVYHPSFILKNGGISKNNKYLESYINDFKSLYNILVGNVNKETIKIESVTEPYYFKLPDWCYTNKVKLFDIQTCKRKNLVYFIFIDENKKRLIHSEPITNNYFYCIEGEDKRNYPFIYPIEKLKLLKNFEEVPVGMVGYESDVRLEHRYAVDYHYYRNKIGVEELNINIPVQFFDIEVYNDGEREFPHPKKAAKPINSISFYNTGDDFVNVYILNIKDVIKDKTLDLDNNNEFEFKLSEDNIYGKITKVKVKVFESERKLLKEYAKNLIDNNIFILSAWNGKIFDFPYVYNRMKMLALDPGIFSPLGLWEQYFKEGRRGKSKSNVSLYNSCYGLYMLDQLVLYKTVDEPANGKKESYSLNFIAKHEIGEEKVAYESTLDNNYVTDIKKFIEYSAVDSKLLYEIDEKTKHIDMFTELVKVCSTTWVSSESTKGLVEPIFLKFLKENKFTAREHNYTSEEVSYTGAFVNTPTDGIKSYVIDLDYTSLYPSIIYTFNIDPTTYYAKIDEKLARDYLFDRSNLPEKFNIIFEPWKYNKIEYEITKEEFIKEVKEKDLIVTIAGTIFIGHKKQLSHIGKLCSEVLSNRKYYKKEMYKYNDNPTMYSICNNRQLAYKILANSIYGVLASKYFRLFDIDLAKTITLTGQEVNKFAQFHASQFLNEKNIKLNTEFLTKIEDNGNPEYILYGDTDSLFLTLGSYMIKNNLIDRNSKTFKEEAIEKTLTIAKELSLALNNNYLVDLVKLHNIDNGYSKLELKQELVADRSLFFKKKKRYAMHIVNQEGHPRDEYAIRGIDIRRSDYPSYTKECMTKILDLILLETNISFLKISEYVSQVEKAMFKLIIDGDKSIARPVSFNKGLEEYDQTKIVSHIQSMVNWNILEYDFFVTGTKGYFYKIKGVDTTKAPKKIIDNMRNLTKSLNYISIPSEVDKLPDYYIIDVEGMLEFSWRSRYKRLLEPIMEDIKKIEIIKSLKK